MKANLGGVHHLVTGINGQGKTLYAVACILRHLEHAKVEYAGDLIPRRLMVSGIKGLAIAHEVVDCPPIDPERFDDKWRGLVREPGEPALDIHHEIQSWWAWCKPGDVIVIDECQRVFRPMAAGRRVPMYIEKLETARHYGVQFLYITQHSRLLHANVRSLVGPHEHVARMFGGMRTIIYQWPTCTDTHSKASLKDGTKTFWKHDKTAFGLYESSQLHTSFKQKIPIAVFGFFGSLLAIAVIAWVLRDRLFGPEPAASVPKKALTAAGQGPVPVAGQAAYKPRSGTVQGGQGRVERQTAYAVGPKVQVREPYEGFGVHVSGFYSVDDRETWFFTLTIDGRVVATIRDADVHRAGYAWRSYGPCAGVLVFGDRERAVSCDVPAVAARPAGPAASAVAS